MEILGWRKLWSPWWKKEWRRCSPRCGRIYALNLLCCRPAIDHDSIIPLCSLALWLRAFDCTKEINYMLRLAALAINCNSSTNDLFVNQRLQVTCSKTINLIHSVLRASAMKERWRNDGCTEVLSLFLQLVRPRLPTVLLSKKITSTMRHRMVTIKITIKMMTTVRLSTSKLLETFFVPPTTIGVDSTMPTWLRGYFASKYFQQSILWSWIPDHWSLDRCLTSVTLQNLVAYRFFIKFWRMIVGPAIVYRFFYQVLDYDPVNC